MQSSAGGPRWFPAIPLNIRVAGLPGRAVVSYDWATGICCDVVASEDVYTSERVLMAGIFGRAAAADLLVMDRYYCTIPVMQAIRSRGASFVVRADERNIRCRTKGKRKSMGRSTTGKACICLIRVIREIRDDHQSAALRFCETIFVSSDKQLTMDARARGNRP